MLLPPFHFVLLWRTDLSVLQHSSQHRHHLTPTMDAHRRPLQIVQNTVEAVARMDWLDHLITVTRMIGELAPFPVLSGVVSIVLMILEPLANIKRNRALFRDLAEKVVRITTSLRDEVLANECVAASPRFIQTCIEFSDCLLGVAADLRDILRSCSKSWVGQYFSAHLLRPRIVNAQKRVDGLLATAVGTRLRVQLMHADLASMRAPPMFADASAELKFNDFHKFIPGDLQLVPSSLHASSSKNQESPVKYSVFVRGVMMTARLYHGENALEQWREDFQIFSNIRHNLLMLFSPSLSEGYTGIRPLFNCLAIVNLHFALRWCFIILMIPCGSMALPPSTRT
ncbi:hypothetical protein DFH06DRAFT_1485267 [Mycena polygramma]|nr:hypothetical protein DFH06DRAFT_1485267 [Mycena polygramma]